MKARLTSRSSSLWLSAYEPLLLVLLAALALHAGLNQPMTIHPSRPKLPNDGLRNREASAALFSTFAISSERRLQR